MIDNPFLGDELQRWLLSDAAKPHIPMTVSRGHVHETWDVALLARDISEVLEDFLMLVRDRRWTLTKLQALAGQPKLYGEFVTESVVGLLGRYALFVAPRGDLTRVFDACRTLVLLARAEGITSHPPNPEG